MMERKTLHSAYREHLENQSEGWRVHLSDLGYSEPGEGQILPTDISQGFRTRMKFKIFRRGGLRAVGMDPLLGERPAGECLWVLPRWSREHAGALLESLSRRDRDFPVDGMELLISHGREQMFAILSVSRKIERSYRGYAAELMAKIPPLIGAAVPSQNVSTGQAALNHRILNYNLSAHFDTFFQSNLQLIPHIVTFVRFCCSGVRRERLLDLYCGVGLHSVVTGQDFVDVWGAESSPAAIRDARANARAAGLINFRYFQSRVESFVRENKVLPSDCVILNPPRSGLGEGIIKSVAASRPAKIISVSCNPETQASDLRSLMDHGYSIQKVAAFDMFPFSPFLETVALLEKSGGS